MVPWSHDQILFLLIFPSFSGLPPTHKNKLRNALMWFHLCFLECPPWLPWISLQSFRHNGTPTSDVSARREWGGQRGGGRRMGGVRKASLLLLITIPPRSPARSRCCGWVEQSWTRRRQEPSAHRFFSHFPSCASFPSPPVNVAEELTQEHGEYFYFTLLHPPTNTLLLFSTHFCKSLLKIGTPRTSFTEISQLKCP